MRMSLTVFFIIRGAYVHQYVCIAALNSGKVFQSIEIMVHLYNNSRTCDMMNIILACAYTVNSR